MTATAGDDLIVIRPQRSGFISRGRTTLSCGDDAFVGGEGEQGLWVYETRLLSRLRWLVDGSTPSLVTSSSTEPHRSLGYFILPRPGSGHEDAPQQTLELRLTRTVGEGLFEDVVLENHTQSDSAFELSLELDADFEDWAEAGGASRWLRTVTRDVERDAGGHSAIVFDCRAQHTRGGGGEEPTLSIHRRLTVTVEESDSAPEYEARSVRFRVELPPHGVFRARVAYEATIDGARLPVVHAEASAERDAWERRTDALLQAAPSLSVSGGTPLGVHVAAAFERARRDLYALELRDIDSAGPTLAAGVPGYLGLFGRDALITGWQSMLLDPHIAAGALDSLGRSIGTRVDDFRDEQPDKIVHEIHRGPLAALAVTPHGRYYGGVSASLEYPAFVASLWHWTGDLALVRRLVPTAHRALRWVEAYGDADGDGFVEYDRRAREGAKNQGWKDSGDAIVYADGTQVPDPLGTAEMQSMLYASLVSFSALLDDLGEHDGAKRYAGRAHELRRRFNDVFWMDDEGFYAMGLDDKKRLIRSIASNGGHVLETGIAEEALVPRVVERLFQPDLFSGWGIRTLSSVHPAYDPWSYHRGSIWPAENAFFAYGLARARFHDQMHALARAQFEAAALFERHRLPELFAGHSRDAEHPFPGIYPRANSPQSWSSSAIVLLLRSMLGVAPYAPLGVVLVDPHLPEWLPDVTLHGLRVGSGVVTIRFRRAPAGHTEFEVTDVRGSVQVLRDAGAPWSSSRRERARAAAPSR